MLFTRRITLTPVFSTAYQNLRWMFLINLLLLLIGCGGHKNQKIDASNVSTGTVDYIGLSGLYDGFGLCFLFSNPPKNVTVNGISAKLSGTRAFWDWREVTTELDPDMVIEIVWEDWVGRKKRRIMTYANRYKH